MSRRAAIALLLLAAGCGAGAPMGEVGVTRVTCETREIELGRGFPLTVVRVLAGSAEPEDHPDDALAPLTLRLLSTERREEGEKVEETRRYLAYAFSPGELTVPALSRDAAPISLRVRPALDPASPGPMELPGGPLREPFPFGLLAVAGAAAIAALAFLLHRRRRAGRTGSAPTPAAPPPPPPPGPHVRALERIARLRGEDPHAPEEVRAFHVEASLVLRDYLGERFSVPASESTEECLAGPRPRADLLARALLPCDLVKFARHPSSAPERAGVLAAAERFVRETAPAEADR